MAPTEAPIPTMPFSCAVEMKKLKKKMENKIDLNVLVLTKLKINYKM
jgi:hypothetical protein